MKPAKPARAKMQEKARKGKKRQEKARKGKKRQEKARKGKKRQEKARKGKKRQEKARKGKKRQEKARKGKKRQEKARKGKKRQEKARKGKKPRYQEAKRPTTLSAGVPWHPRLNSRALGLSGLVLAQGTMKHRNLPVVNRQGLEVPRVRGTLHPQGGLRQGVVLRSRGHGSGLLVHMATSDRCLHGNTGKTNLIQLSAKHMHAARGNRLAPSVSQTSKLSFAANMYQNHAARVSDMV